MSYPIIWPTIIKQQLITGANIIPHKTVTIKIDIKILSYNSNTIDGVDLQ